jgi:hypothetical protein
VREAIRATAIVRAIVKNYKIPHTMARGGLMLTVEADYIPVIRLIASMGKRRHPKAIRPSPPSVGARARLKTTQPPSEVPRDMHPRDNVGFTPPSTEGYKSRKSTFHAATKCVCVSCGETFYDDATAEMTHRIGLTCPFCGAGNYIDMAGKGGGGYHDR